MRIEIEIPKEFEKHFNQDKFKDRLERIMADIEHSLENRNCLCAGRYEYETIEMLEKAFENSKSAYDVNNTISKIRRSSGNGYRDIDGDYVPPMIETKEAIEIIKQGAIDQDFQRDFFGGEKLDIKEPYMNNYCDKCKNHYLLDGDESRCRAISLGMSSAMCVQVKECQKFKEK